MSLFFRKTAVRGSSTSVERRRKPGGFSAGRAPHARTTRRLQLDPLEQRTMLSLTPVDFSDIMVNSYVTANDVTNAARSVASDDEGNFVVAWTHYDSITGLSDIQARYLTDQTERVTLPMETVLKGAGKFTLSISIPDSTGAVGVISTGSISVDPASAWHTAQLIEKAINLVGTYGRVYAPVFFSPPPSSTGVYDRAYNDTSPFPPADVPFHSKNSIPIEVSVVPAPTADDPNGLVTFDITFVGESGKQDLTHKDSDGKIVPALAVTAVVDANNVTPATAAKVDLRRVSTPVFKVNSPEDVDPLGGSTDQSQFYPSVAMDADGEFIIAWQGPDKNDASHSDIYARRFSPMAYVENPGETLPEGEYLLDINGSPAAGARAYGNEFRVNSFTTNDQIQPTVAVDAAGNFAVVWANVAQDNSFFNGVTAQRFTRDGSRVGNELAVSVDDTFVHRDPYVDMAADGWFAVTWDTNIVGSAVQGKVFDNNGNVVQAFNTVATPSLGLGQFIVNGVGVRPTVAMDNAHNVIFAWDIRLGVDTITPVGNVGTVTEGTGNLDVMAKEYNIAGAVVRNNFRINSSTYPAVTGTDTTQWSYGQFNNQIVTDLDGDFTVSFQGYGPDVYEVLAYALGGTAPSFIPHPANDPLMAGEANGVLFSQFDADPRYSTTAPLWSDSVINATRDGQNAIYSFNIDGRAYQNGNSTFTLRITNNDGEVSRFADITIPLQFDANGNLDVMATRTTIETNIQAQTQVVGRSWPESNQTDPPYGPVSVTATQVTPVAEVQTLTIAGAAGTVSGRFTLIGISGQDVSLPAGITNPATGRETAWINFSDDPDVMVANLQAALSQLFPGVIVRSATVPGSALAQYTIEFAGQPGYDIPTIVRGNMTQLFGVTPNNVTCTTTRVCQNIVTYTMYFMGDSHDIDMRVSYPAQTNTCYTQPVAEVQTLTFSGADTAGYFALQVGAGNVTADIDFNLADPYLMGRDIEGKLQALGGDFADVRVTWIAGTSAPNGPQYIVIFGGVGAGVNFATITKINSQRVPNPADPTDPGRWDGTAAGSLGAPDGSFPLMAVPNPNPVQAGSRGTAQRLPSIAMEPDGSFVSGWTQSSGGIWIRRFEETQDTAGPVVTDILQPTGERIDNGGQVNTRLQCVVVTFDEEMMDDDPTAPGFAGNVANWALLKQGASGSFVEYSGAISKVEFGKNKAYDLGLRAIGNNKWEAVVWFDISKVAVTADGETALDQGTYRLIAKNSLREVNGNPLGRTGFNINGVSQTFNFGITVPTATETRVNSPAGIDDNPVAIAGSQPVDSTSPQSPNQVASDGSGRYVAVYTTNALGNVAGNYGVMAQMYEVVNRRSDGTTAATEEKVITSPPIIVSQGHTKWEYAYPSVAMDKDGDFVVTWSARGTPDAGDPPQEDWDIYARRYDASGNPVAGASGRTFRVNSEIENAQKYSTVAVDAEGDFVITWQSRDQDGSGYGIYAQRFDSTGALIGGVNEVQTMVFALKSAPEASDKFDLVWPGFGSATDISVSANITEMATSVRNALIDILAARYGTPADELDTLADQISVTELTNASLSITFTGLNGNTDQPQLVVTNKRLTDATSDINMKTLVNGQAGEVRVNDYTANDQTMPAIAMSNDGKFVITWTSQGQGGDAIYETNIYARLFAANDTVTGSQAIVMGAADVVNSSPDGSTVVETMNFADNPALHVQANTAYTGVGLVTVDDVFAGTGSLLLTGRHVLTAAHLFTDASGNVTAQHVTVTFTLPTGARQVMEVSNINVMPGWTGDASGSGHDLAVLELSQAAPATVARYDIYRNTDEIGRVFIRVGFGASGTGTTGTTVNDQVKRAGQNKYEAVAALAQFYPDGLIYDFDDNTAAHDFFGKKYGIVDVGTGTANESITNAGDSGAPNFIGGLIAGVTSYAFAKTGAWNVAPTVASTFGWGGGDVRVSQYASWIDAVSNGSGTFLVNSTNTTNNQKWSSVAMDADGDFVITWTSYGQDGGGNGAGPGANGQEGVIAKRYDRYGKVVTGTDEFVVNTFIDGTQEWSRVAMDAAGDFIVVWESFEDRPTADTGLPDKPNSWGIYAQRYARNTQIAANGINGRVGGEFRVNATTLNDQRKPAVAVNENGDAMVVWSGYGDQPGQEDKQNGGVFMQIYDQATLDAGPIVTDVLNTTAGVAGAIPQVRQGAIITSTPTSFVVVFDEAMWNGQGKTATPDANEVQSILNPNNWQLSKDGVDVSAPFESISISNAPAGKFAIRLDFAAGGLKSGTYTLTLLDNVANYDPNGTEAGNRLDGDGDGLPGGAFRRVFYVDAGGATPSTEELLVNTTTTGDKNTPSVATDGQGNYAMVWTARGAYGDAATDGNVMIQWFNKQGKKVGAEMIVNTTFLGNQEQAQVAMLPGYTIVVWAGAGTGDATGIFAQVYDYNHKPIGKEVRINGFTDYVQRSPAIAVNDSGDVIITWTSVDSQDAHTGIYARHFQFSEQFETGSAANELSVGPSSSYQKEASQVAVDKNGNYVVVFQFQDQGQYDWAVYSQAFYSSGQARGPATRVHAVGSGSQIAPAVDMNEATGEYVVTWSWHTDVAGSMYDVYYRRYNANGQPRDATEHRANTQWENWQLNSDVAYASDGSFDIVWQSVNRDDKTVSDYDIYRRRFTPDDGIVDPDETRVNVKVISGDQTEPVIVASLDAGNPVIVWLGPDDVNSAVWASCASWRVGSTAAAASTTTTSASAATNWIPTGPGGATGGGNLSDRAMDIGVTTPGLVDPTTNMFYLRDSNSMGAATYTFGYGDPSANWTALIGDWDGDGNESIGFYDPQTSVWYLRNSNDAGFADACFGFGAAGAGWTPLVGDWNGDGIDTAGFYDPQTSVWYLRNSNDTGPANLTFGYGAPGLGWTPLVGSWTGNGQDTIGFFDPATSVVYLRYSNTVGMADNAFGYGAPGLGWTPVVGDWTGTGSDKLGFYDAATSMFYLRNSLTMGMADNAFAYGAAGSGWLPVVGRFSEAQQLTAAAGQTLSVDAAPLSDAIVAPLVSEAIARWQAAGASTEALSAMARARIVVKDLPGAQLGQAAADRIALDTTAAGVGWFVDSSPADDAEFAQCGNGLQGVSGAAVDKMDLLTVIEHELGHIAGLSDVDDSLGSLMSGSLAAGVRRLPGAAASDALFAADAWR